jgi:hypothetical protein
VRMLAGRGSLPKLCTGTVVSNLSLITKFITTSLQVRYVDRGSDRASQMISKQPVVAKLPAEKVADEENGSSLRRARDVSLIGGGRERYALPGRLPIPFEASYTAAGDRHRKRFCCSRSRSHEEGIRSTHRRKSWKAAYYMRP